MLDDRRRKAVAREEISAIEPAYPGLASGLSGYPDKAVKGINSVNLEFEATIAAPRRSKAQLYSSEPPATKLSQKLLQQLVYYLWCVLLHPVGNSRQPLHC